MEPVNIKHPFFVSLPIATRSTSSLLYTFVLFFILHQSFIGWMTFSLFIHAVPIYIATIPGIIFCIDNVAKLWCSNAFRFARSSSSQGCGLYIISVHGIGYTTLYGCVCVCIHLHIRTRYWHMTLNASNIIKSIGQLSFNSCNSLLWISLTPWEYIVTCSRSLHGTTQLLFGKFSPVLYTYGRHAAWRYSSRIRWKAQRWRQV
jgi:hypothetical protein